METKRSKPTKIKPMEELSHGDEIIRRWGIRMENGDAGYLKSTEKECPFTENLETDYLWNPPQEGETYGEMEEAMKKSQRYYMGSLKGQEYIRTLRKEIRERLRQKFGEEILKVPSFAASYTKDIIASKGDFHADEILKDSEKSSGTYSKLYDIVSSKMYADLHRAANEFKEILKKLDSDE